MPIIAKLSLGFAVLFWVEAAFWFGLPWWLVGAGMYNGPIPIIGGAFIALIFASIGFGLFFCYLRARSGEVGRLARILILIFVCLGGFVSSAMACRIVWSFVP